MFKSGIKAGPSKETEGIRKGTSDEGVGGGITRI